MGEELDGISRIERLARDLMAQNIAKGYSDDFTKFGIMLSTVKHIGEFTDEYINQINEAAKKYNLKFKLLNEAHNIWNNWFIFEEIEKEK